MVAREMPDRKNFVKAYIHAFQELRRDIESRSLALAWPEEIAAKILNALLFIEFLTRYNTGCCPVLPQAWEVYITMDPTPGDSFWSQVLEPMLEIITTGDHEHIPVFSREMQDILNHVNVTAPGLIDATQLKELSITISDETMRDIIDQMASFSFLIHLPSEVDSPAAIYPMMLDTASEALARILQSGDQMASRGVFYTTPVEIDLICKVTLLEYFHGELDLPRPDICNLLINHGTYLETLDPTRMANLETIMENLRVLDPACGTGVFLRGLCTACIPVFQQLSAQDGEFMCRLREFIVHGLHGIDTDAQAVQLARMSLWFLLLEQLDEFPEELGMIDLPDLSSTIITADFMQWDDANTNKFHLILGNPPYIRQEDIKPPFNISNAATRVEKSMYKEAIIEALKNGVPPVSKFNKMSDYYVYFFFKGVQHLHDHGIVGFVTSNSWLDANFGKDLQEYLLTTTRILAIIDFATRSFDAADVNTAITICRRLNTRDMLHVLDAAGSQQETRFVHFKQPPASVPFTDLVKIFDEPASNDTLIHSTSLPYSCRDEPSFRIFNIHPGSLLHDEFAADSSRDDARDNAIVARSYFGDRWRVKYLNASDLFYTILKKGQEFFVNLGALADVKAGCYTGINEFFYLDDQVIHAHGIEKEFYRPILRNSDDVTALAMNETLDHFVLVIPHVSKSTLLEQGFHGVVSYIEWGESQKTKRGQKTSAGISWPQVQSVKVRPFWYSLPMQTLEPANQFMQYIAHDRFFCPWSVQPLVSDRSFHRFFPRDGVDPRAMHAVLNSTVQAFLVMTTGRSSLGGGALKIEAADAKEMLAIDVCKLKPSIIDGLLDCIARMDARVPRSFFIESGLDPSRPFDVQRPHPLDDRLALDTIVLDLLGLDNEERDELYRSTCEAINMRLKKAKTRKGSTK